MIDAALAAEISADPAELGYATLVAADNLTGLASLLNDRSKASVARQQIRRDEFLLAILPMLDALGQKDNATQAKYASFLDLVKAADRVSLTPVTAAIVQELVTDGIGAQAQIDAILNRPGSRSEAVLGHGVNVTEVDVGRALYGDER